MKGIVEGGRRKEGRKEGRKEERRKEEGLAVLSSSTLGDWPK
jgi:hypothetical protein